MGKEKKLRKMRKFRFQLLHKFIIKNFKPCKVADVGGGKGLLAYLLKKDGFDAFVIDPFNQELPKKYKDLEGNKEKMNTEKIPRITKKFKKEMIKDFDLIIGLHAHGSNMNIIEGCAKYKKDFILMPCCVIDEPIIQKPNIDWFDSLVKYAKNLGHDLKYFELNCTGQNKGFYTKKI